MKFTLETFLEALKTRLTDKGKKNLSMSERTFKSNVERIYKRLEKADDEELELDAAVEDYLPDLETIEGNMRKDNADFIKRWNKAHPASEEDAPNPTSVEPTDKIDLLLKEIGELKKEREAEKAAKELYDYKADVSKQLGEKLKDFDNAKGWIERRLKGYAFDPKADKEELVKSLVADYNADFAGVKLNTTPKRAGADFEKQDPELAKIRKMREEQIKREKENI